MAIEKWQRYKLLHRCRTENGSDVVAGAEALKKFSANTKIGAEKNGSDAICDAGAMQVVR